MNINFKKIIGTTILTTCMLFNVSNVYAEETYTLEEQLAIDKLGSIGVMIGTENGFEGTSNLTRAQAAAIMVRIKGVTEEAVESERKKGKSNFKDVSKDHWALGYINIANTYGIIKGISETEFSPDSKVKVSELVTMAVRSLNAGNMVEESKKEWPDNYMEFAKDEDLIEEIKSSKDDYATRCETAIIVSKTLETDTWKVSGVVVSGNNSKNTYARQKEETLLKNVFKVERYVDEEISSLNSSKKQIKFSDYADDEESNVPVIELDERFDTSRIKKGDNVEVWYSKNNKKIIMVSKVEKGKNNVNKEYNFSRIEKYVPGTGKITLNVNGKNFVCYLDVENGDEEVGRYNGEKKTVSKMSKLLSNAIEDEKLDEITGKVKVVGTKIKELEFGIYDFIGIVDEVTNSKVYFKDKEIVIGATTGNKETITENNSVVCNIKGEVLDFDAIKDGYVIKYYFDEANEEYHVMTYSKNETGEVTARNSKVIEVDDEEYTINFIGEYEKPEENENIKIYLNADDEIIMYTQDEDLCDYLEEDEEEADDDDEEDDEEEEIEKEKIECDYGIITSAVGSTKSGKKVLYLTISTTSGSTIKKYVNLEEMLKMYNNKFDDKSILQESIIDNCVGSFVQYQVEDKEFVLYDFGSYKYSGVYDRSYNKTSARLLTSNSTIGGYNYNTKTQFYLATNKENDTLDVKCTLEEIKVSDLKNKSYYSISAYSEDASKDVDYVIIREEEAEKVENEVIDTYGVLISHSINNEIVTINVATQNGLKTYKSSIDVIDSEELVAGSYITYTAIGNVITNYEIDMPNVEEEDEVVTIKLVKAKVYKMYEDGVRLAFASGNEDFISADNIILLKATIKEDAKNVTMTNISVTTTKPSTITDTSNFTSTSGQVVYCYTIRKNNKDYIIAMAY